MTKYIKKIQVHDYNIGLELPRVIRNNNELSGMVCDDATLVALDAIEKNFGIRLWSIHHNYKYLETCYTSNRNREVDIEVCHKFETTKMYRSKRSNIW